MARRLKGAASARQRQLARAHDEPGAETLEHAAARLGYDVQRTRDAFRECRLDVVERRRNGRLELSVGKMLARELAIDHGTMNGGNDDGT